jgi:pilus assembly protein Flp/PilA
MLKQMLDYYKIRFGGDEGATAVEYGLMVALIAVVIIGAVILLGQNLEGTFDTVADSVGGAGEGGGGTE